jgi:hypothetical protein
VIAIDGRSGRFGTCGRSWDTPPGSRGGTMTRPPPVPRVASLRGGLAFPGFAFAPLLGPFLLIVAISVTFLLLFRNFEL